MGCLSHKNTVKSERNVGIKVTTQNANFPIIFKNGWKYYKIEPIVLNLKKDSILVNELKFYGVFSASYVKQFMFEKFGIWDKIVQTDLRNFVLIWENKHLFHDNNEVYSVVASGTESREEIYASVMVFDSKNRDCLSKNYLMRDSLVDLFSNGIKNLSSKDDFYDVFHHVIDLYRKQQQKK